MNTEGVDQLARAEDSDADWFLLSPLRSSPGGYEWRGLVVDVEVWHGVGHWPTTDADRPRVAALTIRPADGETFGERTLSIDVHDLAAEVVIASAANVQVRRPKGDGYSNGGPEAWRQAARAARMVAAGYRRYRWTPELEKRVADTWRHLREHGCGTQADLAGELGITPNQLSAKLSELRTRWDIVRVPEGTRGRRPNRIGADQ